MMAYLKCVVHGVCCVFVAGMVWMAVAILLIILLGGVELILALFGAGFHFPPGVSVGDILTRMTWVVWAVIIFHLLGILSLQNDRHSNEVDSLEQKLKSSSDLALKHVHEINFLEQQLLDIHFLEQRLRDLQPKAHEEVTA